MNHPKSIIRAKQLRKNMSEPEVIFWAAIQKNKLGHQFRRQHSIGKYYADFVCIKKKLVIELDGFQHMTDTAIKYDNDRTDFIKSNGWTVIRISNGEIRCELDAVLESLELVLNGAARASEMFPEKYDTDPNRDWVPPVTPPPKPR